MTKGMFDDLFGENGQNLTEAQRKEAQRKKTKEEYEYVSGGVAYKPYDRLIALSQGERTGGVADQMLVEANRLRQAGYTDVYREFGLTEAYEKVTKWGTSFIVGTGKALQPLAAPQQIFFGNVGGLTDLVQGDVKGAMKTWGRGMNAAIGFATYGKLNGEKRDQAIWGKDLANDWGIKGTAGAVTGGLMDFFADPLLLAGVVGKAGSLARAGKLGDMLTPGSRVAAMGDAEAIMGGASRKMGADIFQAATSMVDVVNNVSAGAIKNPAAFRRAAGEILQNPLQTTRSIPGLFSDDAKYAGTPWATIRENLDAAGAVEGALSFANAVARIPSSKAPLKQAWQAIPLSARMAMGQGVGSLVEGARFVPLMMGNATTSGLTVAESIISRWGTIPGIPEVNIAKLKETGKSYGAGVSRVLQESFRQRQIEAANMGLRATDLTSRYAKITGKMDEATKKGFDHFSSKVLDAKDPAALITAWRDFETFTGAHNVTEIGADFLRRVTDYDVYGATVRARLGLESQSGVHSYEAGRDLLNMIVRGEFDKAQDIVNQWQDYMVNPAFQNIMVRGYTDITDDTGKVIGQRPRYNPVIGGNSPATPLGQKVQRTLFENKADLSAPRTVDPMAGMSQAERMTYIAQALRQQGLTSSSPPGDIAAAISRITNAPSGNRVPKLPTEQFSPILNAAETKTPELTDWNKAIMELPQSARAGDIRSASVFGGDPTALSSAKVPENLKSTQDFMDEVVPLLDERMGPDVARVAADEATGLAAQFPKNMARYKALTANEEANIRRVQSVLYMDEMKIRDADMGGADIPAELVPGLSPFRATYVENGITYVKPEPPQLIRGDDGGIYVRTGDDQVMKVVTDKDGKLYGYGNNIANSSKRKKTAFVDESDRPLDPSVQPNVGGGREYIALGAIRNDPAAIMEGYQLGVLNDQLDNGRETAEWLAKKSNDDFNAAAGLQDSWDAQVNSIFDSKLIDEIKPVNFSPDKVQVYDNASKGWPPNNPDRFRKPDGTLDIETVNRLREQFPGWDIFTPRLKDADYDNALFFHGGRPPGDDLFAGNPRDYAQAVGLAGKGIYLTSWDGMAGNYGRGASTMSQLMGSVYAVRLGKGQKFLNMDKLPSDPQAIIRRTYAYLMEGQSDATKAGLKAERDAINGLVSAGKIGDGFDLLNAMRYGNNTGVTTVSSGTISLTERANAWHDALIDRGYTGMRHLGGIHQGNGDDLHDVVILLGSGREFNRKAIQGRKQLAMYDPQTGELIRRSDPLGEAMKDPKKFMAVKSSQKGSGDPSVNGITVRLATANGKPARLDRLTPEQARGASMEISIGSVHADVMGTDRAAIELTDVLSSARGKGVEKVVIETSFNETAITDPARKVLMNEDQVDDLLARIPGANPREIYRSDPDQMGRVSARYEIDLTDNIFADRDAVFGPHGYRKNFGTEADLKGGLSSTKADYGRQTSTTENPFAPIWADRQPNSWNWDERLGAQTHLRRMFMASENPERVIRAIDKQRAAAVMFDTDRLERAMLRALVANNKNDVTAREFAEQFQKAWSDPDVAPIDQLTDFFKSEGLTGESLLKLLTEVNNDVWKLGIDYRPPGKELARQMHEYLAGTSMVGPSSGPLQNATSRAAEKSRADLAPHWQEALMQIDDIGEAIAKNSEVNEKVISRRGMVQDMYTFLKDEGGIISKDEWPSKLASRQGWFTITEPLHTQMKGLRAENAGIGDDLPFQVGDMIPAAYGQALFSAVTTAKPGVAQATLQYLNARWKQAKLANPATIGRDIGSNFAIAEGMGISPLQLTRGLGMMARLYAESKKAGRGFIDLVDDMAEIQLKNGVKVSMRSMSEASDFIHSGMLANEVTEPLTRLARELGNPVGNSFQRTVAAFQKYGQDVKRVREQGGAKGAALGAASVASQVAGVPGSAIKYLSDFKGQVDMFHKGAVYLLKLEEGLSPAKAAAYADEVFFNYQNVPYFVDFLRRSAISPFAAWQFLSAGRLIKTMYENPYAIHRLYRIPGSIRQGVGEQEYDDEARARSQYMRNSLWLPAVEAGGENGFRIKRDKEGRSSWFNFGAMLPEQSTADLFLNGPGGLFSQAASPTIEMLAGLVSGQGFRGMSLYPGGGNLDESMRSAQPIRDRTKEEAARTLYRFGMTPWAPGQPMMERIMDSIEYTRQDYIVHPGAEKFMRLIEDYYRDGPVVNAVQAATPSDNYRQELSTAYRQPPLELRNTIVAMFGLGISGVQPNPSKPGTMMGNYLGMQSKLKDLEAQAMREIMNATPENRDAIRQTYRKEIDKLRLDLDTLKIQRNRENQTVQPADQLEF